MYVSITQLKKSDSGLYTCSLDRNWLPDAIFGFRIIVTEASTETTLQRFTTSRASSSTQSLSSSSGRFTPSSSSSSETNKQPETESPAGTVLVISLILVVMIFMLTVAVLICRKRKRKFKGSPVETMYDNVRESSRVYDEIGDPVEMSTVYTLISPNGVRPTDEYSLATGTCAQNQTEDGEVSYSQVKVPEGEASVPSANTDKVVYSEVRVEDSSPSLAGDASPPLYSEVASPQK
ncbi:hypothetical protein Q5P01_008220 [Channa striata]|uniref:Uncharacterized protein n=1 Tax=Channa striata TaxID=64152 RepID=A0AA88N9W4_CHASR|nr:hypothetical protein Q5P01_008220 [Channa striata]